MTVACVPRAVPRSVPRLALGIGLLAVAIALIGTVYQMLASRLWP